MGVVPPLNVIRLDWNFFGEVFLVMWSQNRWRKTNFQNFFFWDTLSRHLFIIHGRGFTFISYHILDLVFSPSTELAGFCMVICLYYSSPFRSITCILFPQSIFLHLILYLLFPRLFRSSSSSTTTHFKFQSLHYHIFISFLKTWPYHRILLALAMLEASHCPFNYWASSRETVNTNFYSLWFDRNGIRTRVYRFNSRRSIHSTTDRAELG